MDKPGVTEIVPDMYPTLDPPVPADLPSLPPLPPAPPYMTTDISVISAGTVKVSVEPVAEKVHVLTFPLVVQEYACAFVIGIRVSTEINSRDDERIRTVFMTSRCNRPFPYLLKTLALNRSEKNNNTATGIAAKKHRKP
jgi:hypothetical protein